MTNPVSKHGQIIFNHNIVFFSSVCVFILILSPLSLPCRGGFREGGRKVPLRLWPLPRGHFWCVDTGPGALGILHCPEDAVPVIWAGEVLLGPTAVDTTAGIWILLTIEKAVM